MKILFTKMAGAGNDFIIVDTRRHRLPRLPWPLVSRALCDRRRGIGADGLLVLERSRVADVRMRVFNPDGSEAEMCGNGARCVALYQAASNQPAPARANGGPGQSAISKRRVAIETRAGVLPAMVRGGRVTIQMTDPKDIQPDTQLTVNGRRVRVGFINTGVPHAVVRVSALDRVDVLRLGRALRRHRRFAPRGTNVDFIQPNGRAGRLRIRTYERGVEGETLACGTGVAASAILHALTRGGRSNGRTSRHRIEVETRSGELLAVSFRVVPAGDPPGVTEVVLEGPARRVFDGAVEWPKERKR